MGVGQTVGHFGQNNSEICLCEPMSLDFNKLDIQNIMDKRTELLDELVKPADWTFDPLFGFIKNTPPHLTTFQKKHGTLIQQTLKKIILASDGWVGMTEYKHTLPKTNRKMFIDNTAINKKLGIVLLIECKRNSDRLDSGARRNIGERNRTILKTKSVMTQVFLDTKLLDKEPHLYKKIVFNAYGQNFNAIEGVPVIGPNDLHKIFGSYVQYAFDGFINDTNEEIKALPIETSINDPSKKSSIPIHQTHEFLSHEDRDRYNGGLIELMEKLPKLRATYPSLDEISAFLSKKQKSFELLQSK